MVKDPLSLLDSLVVAISGFVIVFLMLAALWGIIIVISKLMDSVTKPAVPAAASAASEQKTSAPAAPAPTKTAPVEEDLPVVPLVPEIELGKNVTEAEAACIMAIVCYETGIPFNELIFKSIKLK